MEKRPPKIPDHELIPLIRAAAASGRYRETYHQRIENIGRTAHDVTRQEVEQILLAGSRDHARDKFEPYMTWSYVFDGKTIDGRFIRVVVAVDEGLPVIVSVYAPQRGGRK